MLLQANALHIPLADQSVNCCVTSPPYWGLRDYGATGQLGLEPTPAEYVAQMVEVFREVWRVLRCDGTCWLNLGDSYASTAKGNGGHGHKQDTNTGSWFDGRRVNGIPDGLKEKDLCGIPWRVAFALQADGWYLRSDIIWSKPNPMPESVTDRPTKAHEYLFLLSKSARYFYDAEAVKEEGAEPERERGDAIGTTQRHLAGRSVTEIAERTVTRNRRTVWEIATAPFSGAHFATYPPALVEPCILAGTEPGGIVLDCFAGSGTTGQVARLHGRRFVGLDISREYLATLALPRAEGRNTAASIATLPLFAQAGG